MKQDATVIPTCSYSNCVERPLDGMVYCAGHNPSAPARKHDGLKLRFDLIPVTPLEELARAYTIGANKYGDRNWEKGLKWSRIFGAMLRHAWAFWRGEQKDKEDGQHHLASVAWCALALIEYERTHPNLDDRQK